MLRYLGATLLALSIGQSATPSVTARDIDGRVWTLLAPAAKQLDVLFFISRDCPISNHYAPEISRICRDYRARGVRCFMAYPDPDADVRNIASHRREFGYGPGIPAFLDRDYVLARAVGAGVTPQAAIYSSTGLVYRGRIDDLYLNAIAARREPTRHDVRLALDAALAGKPVTQPETQAVGCYIPVP